jgi:DNA-binding NarL/FixJ family response regulator
MYNLQEKMVKTVTVKVCEPDPITRFGLVTHIRQDPGMALVPPVREERADVIVATVDNANEQSLDALRPLATPAAKRFLVIVGGGWSADLHTAVDLGVRGVLFRRDFNWTKFRDSVRAISAGQGAFPTDLQGKLLDQVDRTVKEVLAPRGLTASGLTTREIDILRLVAEGDSLEDIAGKLQYSERTVKNVLYGLMKRLNLRNRAHAVSYAIRSGVI